MAIDVWQFWPTYFDESLEGLNSMESDLLALDPGAADPETIDSIFRVAHSIKGGSGTFGLTEISDFTHHVETLLDQMRDGRRAATQVSVTVLLSSVDCLRWMLDEANSRRPINVARGQPVVDALLKIMSDDESSEDTPESADADGHALFDQSEVPDAAEDAEASDSSEETVDKSAADYVPTLENDGFELFGDTVEDDDEPTAADDESVAAAEPGDEPVPAPEDADAKPAADAKVAPAAADAPTHPLRRASDLQPGDKSASSVKGNSLRVATHKIDSLVNLVGEMVIVQSMLGEIGDGFEMSRIENLRSGLEQLEQSTRELQESVMQVRMEPISHAFQPMPRLVRDLSTKLGKEARLTMSGEMTELDKTVAERIADSLMHLVRNALDHGLEGPEEREAAGKDRMGTVHLAAEHRGGQIVIEVSDDGAGLNPERIRSKAIERGLLEADDKSDNEALFDLIFHAGLSTAVEVSDVSGRGVGMDVVRRNIRALGGTVRLHSTPGKGTSVTIHLPLTLAIIEGQLVRLGTETYVLPLLSIIESVKMADSLITWVPQLGPVYHFRGDHIRIIPLHEHFDVAADSTELEDGMLVIVEGEGHVAGFLVDELLGHRQIVVKNLDNYEQIDGIAGATILGDGTVALIMNVGGVINTQTEPQLA